MFLFILLKHQLRGKLYLILVDSTILTIKYQVVLDIVTLNMYNTVIF